MKGSEKQVAWAEKIREGMKKYCYSRIEQCKWDANYFVSEGRTERAELENKKITAWNEALSNLDIVDEAEWFIKNRDNFKSHLMLDNFVSEKVKLM